MNQEQARKELEAAHKLMHADLTTSQRDFIESTARYTVIAGGPGMGKAFILRKTIIELALENPGITIAVFARDMNRLNEKIGNYLVYDGIQSLKWPKRLTVQNGSCIYFLCGRTVKDMASYAGMEFEIIAVCEAQDITEDQHSCLKQLNRTARAGGTPRMIYTAGTGGVGHQWIKRLFIDQRYKPYEKDGEYRFIKATINQDLIERANATARREIAELLTAKPKDAQREKRGDCHD